MGASKALARVGDHDQRYWRRHIIIGIGFTFARAVIGVWYVTRTWDSVRRPLMLAVALAIPVFFVMIGRPALRQVDNERLRMRFLWWWAGVNLAATVAIVWLDNGLQSPAMLSLFPILTYVAMAGSPRFVATVGAASLLVHAILALHEGPSGGPAAVYVGVNLVLVTALLVAFARNSALVRAARDEATRTLTTLATRDALTGLLNRAALTERLASEVDRARRSNSPVSVLILDVDHFKAVNDTWGHATGDAVLQSVAAAAGSAVRPYDALGRWGGEEFCAVLSDTTLEEARGIAERVRAAVEADQDSAVRVTVSVGVSCSVEFEDDVAQSLLAEADGALYAAKTAGRNQVMARPGPRGVASMAGAQMAMNRK